MQAARMSPTVVSPTRTKWWAKIKTLTVDTNNKPVSNKLLPLVLRSTSVNSKLTMSAVMLTMANPLPAGEFYHIISFTFIVKFKGRWQSPWLKISNNITSAQLSGVSVINHLSSRPLPKLLFLLPKARVLSSRPNTAKTLLKPTTWSQELTM